jgi:hypothetical protein
LDECGPYLGRRNRIKKKIRAENSVSERIMDIVLRKPNGKPTKSIVAEQLRRRSLEHGKSVRPEHFRYLTFSDGGRKN